MEAKTVVQKVWTVVRGVNPRTGEATRLGEFTDKNRRAFEPPADGDWVLVLDDAGRKIPLPSSAQKIQ